MSRRPRRQRSDWKRIALTRVLPLLAIAIAATYAIRDSAARVLAPANPGLAHDIAPWDGVITAASALEAMQAAGVDKLKVTPTLLARQALRQDPTAVDAHKVLAADAQLHGDTERTRDLFRYSLTLSRRELTSRLWAIEEAVSRGDIHGALTNYDVALKTSRDAADLLYPVLANALSEPRIRAELLRLMRARPNWAPEFIDYISRAAPNPEGAAAFYPMLERAGLKVSSLQKARVVDALSARGYDAKAWEYYSQLHPAADRRRSRNPDFGSSAAPPTLFDWQALSENGLSASIGAGEGSRGELAFFIPPASSGKLARQRQLLPPGRYTLSGRAQGPNVPARERPHFSVVCDMGRELAQVPVPSGAKPDFAADFTVTADCPTQYLVLVARQTDAPSGIEGRVERAGIAPAGSSTP